MRSEPRRAVAIVLHDLSASLGPFRRARRLGSGARSPGRGDREHEPSDGALLLQKGQSVSAGARSTEQFVTGWTKLRSILNIASANQ